MPLFRTFLMVFLVALAGYTAVTVSIDGWNLIPIFFGDMLEMRWPGQFNFDFMGFLLLSAIWTAWRNDFSVAGLGLAVIASVGGMLFLTIYLLVLSYQTKGNTKEMMFGKRRANL